MTFLSHTSWEEVFAGWRGREAQNPAWIRCATEVKGWPDWESWRQFTAHQLNATTREWQIFAFDNPMDEIPRMLLGPYSGWQSRAPQKNATSFEQLLAIPEQREHFRNHAGVQSIMTGLPFVTQFIGLIRDDTQRIVCIEGHHRTAAITLAKLDQKTIDFSRTRVTIALAHLSVHEISLLDTILARGTSKTPAD